MKIYTKQGDLGQTGLFGGERVSKDHRRLWAYGTLDELNSCLGVVLSQSSVSTVLRERLQRIQGELFRLGAELATPPAKRVSAQVVEAAETERLEVEIDSMEESLPPLKTFILPGGTATASFLHLARTVSRRAEREIVALHLAEPQRPEVIRYVNRLSDYFFVTARYANLQSGVSDVPWRS